MKYIILDTNILVQDFWLDGHAFSALLPNFKAEADHLAIPEVVIDETVSQFRKKSQEANNSAIKALKNLQKYIKSPKTNVSFNLDVEVDKYSIALEDKLKSYDIEIIEYPNVKHSVIAKKAMNRTKPFKGKGEGYCDALIWQNIIDLMLQGNEVVFITNNTTDFFYNDVLAKELEEELLLNNIAISNIALYKNLREFVDKKLLLHLTNLDDLKNKINSNQIGFNDWLEDNLFNVIDPEIVAEVAKGLTADCYVSLSEIYDYSALVALEARMLDSNVKYIRLKATLGIGLDICADYQQFKKSGILNEIFGAEHVIPYEYDCVQANYIIDMVFSLTVTNDDFSDGNIEILSYSGDDRLVSFL